MILGGEFLEEELVGDKTLEYGVAEQKCLQVVAKLRELFLDAVNEDSKSSRWHSN